MKFGRRTSTVASAGHLADGDLRALLIQDRAAGWRAFIDQFTPALLAQIERAGVRDRDEAMELYVLVCERLAADDCARLRRHDPAKGALGAWLAVLVRHVVVDWVRSRAGRRRLFKSIKDLPALERRVFELFYWENRSAAEMVGLLDVEFGSPSLAAVLDAFERVQAALTERQRAELLATAARATSPASLDAAPDADAQRYDVPDPKADPERAAQTKEVDRVLDEVLRELPPEDAAIVRLKYVEGLSLKQIREALHLDDLSEPRVRGILETLKMRLTRRRMGAADTAALGVAFFERGRQ